MPSLLAPGADQFDALLPDRDHPGAELWLKKRHLLDTSELSLDEVEYLLSMAGVCKKLCEIGTPPLAVLTRKTVANVFYENSTRTRSSFELAAKKLGATVLNLDVGTSSVSKGETVSDTALNLIALGVDAIVQRHSLSGSAHALAEQVGNKVQIINAGDGWHGHPTQGLLDLFTMKEVKPDLKDAKVAIIGDIMHSRVARSIIWLLKLYGASVHVAGPPTLIPAGTRALGITVHNKLDPAVEDCDFVMALRMQLERQSDGLIPSMGEYKRLYRLDHHHLRLAKTSVKVLHPGPVNRGIEITSDLVDDPEFSLIATQVKNGVAVRMAVLHLLLNRQGQQA